jgi:hypothetical protein
MPDSGGFCTLCSHKVDSFDGLTQCPNCGSKGKPCGNEDQVSISINVHEIRLLCIWAENWAGTINDGSEKSGGRDLIYAIANRIKPQLPESKRSIPLTMREEFGQLKQSFPDFETNHKSADNPETGENYRQFGGEP